MIGSSCFLNDRSYYEYAVKGKIAPAWLSLPTWLFAVDYEKNSCKESFGTIDLQIANLVNASFPKSSTVGHVAFGGGTKLNIIVKSYESFFAEKILLFDAMSQ